MDNSISSENNNLETPLRRRPLKCPMYIARLLAVMVRAIVPIIVVVLVCVILVLSFDCRRRRKQSQYFQDVGTRSHLTPRVDTKI